MFRTTLVVQESSFRRLNASTISPSRRGRRGGEVQAETVRSRPDAARPHPEADGVRRECPEFAAPPRMTGLSAPRLGEARALLGTARPRRCLTAAAVRGWAGTLRCRGTPATAGAAGGAGRTRSHECCPSVGAAVRPTAAAVGAESHRTAGSRCSAGTQASTSTTRPPSSTGYTTRPNHPPPGCAHSASRPGHRPVVARQAAHPAVPGTRGPLATDPGQRRPLGQRQSVPPTGAAAYRNRRNPPCQPWESPGTLV